MPNTTETNLDFYRRLNQSRSSGNQGQISTALAGGNIQPQQSIQPTQGVEEQKTWWDNVLGFLDSTREAFQRGFVGTFEGIADLGATILGTIGDATGWYSSTPFTDFAKNDIAGNYAKWYKVYGNSVDMMNPWGMIEAISSGKLANPDFWQSGFNDLINVFNPYESGRYDEAIDKYYGFDPNVESDAGNFVLGLSESAGMMLPTILPTGFAKAGQISAQAAKGIGYGLMFGGAAGKKSEEVLNEGGKTWEALLTGAISGGVEVLTEELVGRGLEKVAKALHLEKLASSFNKFNGIDLAEKMVAKAPAHQIAASLFEEGMEEVASELVSPFIDAIYKKDKAFYDEEGNSIFFSKDFWSRVGTAFLSGAVMGGTMTGVGIVYSKAKYGPEGSKILQNMEEINNLREEWGNNDIAGKSNAEIDKRVQALTEDTLKQLKELKESTDPKSKRYFMNLISDIYNADFSQSTLGMDQAYEAISKDLSMPAYKHFAQTIQSALNEKGVPVRIRFESAENMTNAKLRELGLIGYSDGSGEGVANRGYFNPSKNEIVLNENYKDGISKGIRHEAFSHAVLDMAEKSRDSIVKAIKANSEWNKRFHQNDSQIKKYYSEDRWDSERLAFFMEDTLQNPKTFRELFDKQSALKELVQKAKGLFNKVKGLDAKIAGEFNKALTEASRQYRKAARESKVTITESDVKTSPTYATVALAKDIEQEDYDRHPERDPLGFVKMSDGTKVGLTNHLDEAIEDLAGEVSNISDYRAGVTDDYDGYVSKRVVNRWENNASQMVAAIEERFGDDFGDLESFMEDHSEEDLSKLIAFATDVATEDNIDNLEELDSEIGEGDYPNGETPEHGSIADLAETLADISETTSWKEDWEKIKNDVSRILKANRKGNAGESRYIGPASSAYFKGADADEISDVARKLLQEEIDGSGNAGRLDVIVDEDGDEYIVGTSKLVYDRLNSFFENARKDGGWEMLSVAQMLSEHDKSDFENAKFTIVSTGDDLRTVTVTNDGNIINLLNRSKKVGWITKALALAIDNGGYKLDCYDLDINQADGFNNSLPHLYQRYGFTPVSAVPYNEKYVDERIRERFTKANDKNPVVFMLYTGEIRPLFTEYSAVQKYIKQGGVKLFKDEETGWDEAYSFRDKADVSEQLHKLTNWGIYSQAQVGEDGKIIEDKVTRSLFKLARAQRARAEEAFPEIKQKYFVDVANKYGLSLVLDDGRGGTIPDPSMKSVSSMADRLYRNIGEDPLRDTADALKDHIRGTFIFGEEQIPMLEDILHEYDGHIVKLDPKKKDPSYRGIHLNLRFGDNNVEIQLHTKDSWRLKVAGDDMYEKYRSISESDMSPEELAQKNAEKQKFIGKWAHLVEEDPAFRRLYSLSASLSEKVAKASSSSGLNSLNPASSGPQTPSTNSEALPSSSTRTNLLPIPNLYNVITDTSDSIINQEAESVEVEEVLKKASVEPSEPTYKIPRVYIKDSADLNNAKVFSYRQALETIRSLSKEIMDVFGLDSKTARVTFDGKAMEASAERLFEIFNKRKSTPSEFAKGIVDLFKTVNVESRSRSYGTLFDDIGSYPDVMDAIEKSISKYGLSSEDSFKVKTEERIDALKRVFADAYIELKGRLAEAKALIKEVGTLRKEKTTIPRQLKSRIEGTKDAELYKIATSIVDPIIHSKTIGERGIAGRTNDNGFIKEKFANVLEMYTPERYTVTEDGESVTPLFPFDATLRNQIQALHDSLPDPTDKVIKGRIVQSVPPLTSYQVKQMTSILRNVKGIFEKAQERDVYKIKPIAVSAFNVTESAQSNKFLQKVILNPVTSEFSSTFSSIDGWLGYSELSYNLTLGMEQAMGDKNKFVGERNEEISSKIKELGIDKDLAKVKTFRGAEIQVDYLVDMYAGLLSDNKENFAKNGLEYMDRKGKTHVMLEATKAERVKGSRETVVDFTKADELISELESRLTDNEKAYANWLLEYYNKNLQDFFIEAQKQKGLVDITLLEKYYPRVANDMKAQNAYMSVKAPKVFGHGIERVKHNRPFRILSATSRVASYVNDLGMEIKVRPLYEQNIATLNSRMRGGKTLFAHIANAITAKKASKIMEVLNAFVGLDRDGRTKSNGKIGILFSNYSLQLLSANVGTPFKQTISALFSTPSLKYVSKGLLTRIFGSKEFKNEFNSFSKEFGEIAYRAKYSADVDVDLSTGGKRVFNVLKKFAQLGMKPISFMDIQTIKVLLAGSMLYAKDAGYSMGTTEAEQTAYKEKVRELFAMCLENQIGSLPTNQSFASLGVGDTGNIGRFLTFMGGPARGALAAFIDKLNTWSYARKFTADGVKTAISEAESNVKAAEENLKTADKKLESAEIKLDDAEENLKEGVKAGFEAEETSALEELVEKARASYDEAVENRTKAVDELVQSQANLSQAKMDQKTFERYKMMGGRGWLASSAVSMAIGSILFALIEEFAKRARGKKRWQDEFNGQEFADNAITYFMYGWLPVANSIASAAKGYDSSFPDAAILKDAMELITNVAGIFSNGFDEKSLKSALRSSLQAISVITGLPIKNVYNLLYGTLKGIDPTFSEELKGLFYVNSYTNAKVIQAVEDGHYSLAKSYISKISEQNAGAISHEVQNEFFRLVQNGESPMPSAVPTSYKDEDGSDTVITWTQQQEAKKFYSRANGVVAKVISSPDYRKLENDEKAALIKSIYSAYKTAGLYKAIGTPYRNKVSKLALVAKSNSLMTANIMTALARVKSLSATDAKTKKELAVEYVNSLALSKTMKMLVLSLAGYKVDESLVKSALMGLGLTTSEISLFLG